MSWWAWLILLISTNVFSASLGVLVMALLIAGREE